jgi:hypothetical protein
MIHIAPWSATAGLFAGAARILASGGLLYTYGPYMRGETHTSEGNARFDADLRLQNAEWGIRSIEALTQLALSNGLAAPGIVPMPSNNFSLIFRRPV